MWKVNEDRFCLKDKKAGAGSLRELALLFETQPTDSVPQRPRLSGGTAAPPPRPEGVAQPIRRNQDFVVVWDSRRSQAMRKTQTEVHAAEMLRQRGPRADWRKIQDDCEFAASCRNLSAGHHQCHANS